MSFQPCAGISVGTAKSWIAAQVRDDSRTFDTASFCFKVVKDY
jgi:hypothetical protein